MSMNQENYPPLTMLPVLLMAVAGSLEASQEQLNNLRRAEKKPYSLDDKTVNRVIKSYTEQNKTLVHEKTICEHWRKQTLNPPST